MTRVVHILLVDAIELFRRFISLILLADATLHIAGEASDGLEAVQKAKEIQPDLILLDFDLPSVSGIELVRRMRRVSTLSKIVVVTHHSSPAVLREAFAAGGQGYITKARVVQDLLPAIEAVLQGDRFVSKGLAASLDDV